MLKQLKYVPSLLTVLTLMASGPALAQVPDADVKRNDNLTYYSRISNTYFATDLGLSAPDYDKLQQAEGYLRDGNQDRSLTILKDLHTRYPEILPIDLLLAKTYLIQEEESLALSILEDMLKQIDPLRAETHELMVDAILLQVKTYREMKKPDEALQLLQAAPIQIKLLNDSQGERYYLALAELLYELKRPEEAYRLVNAVISSGLRGTNTRNRLLNWSPNLAEQMYSLGLQAYRENNYTRTLRMAQIAYQLNPNPVKFSQLMEKAQNQIHVQVNSHYQNALPALDNAIRNMRYALLQEDFGALHKEYLRLRDHQDVAFFLNRDYEGYLPYRMQRVLQDVETVLVARGYKI